MPASNPNGHAAETRDGPRPARRRTPWPLLVVAVLFVVVPFLAWYTTWFGRALTDEQIEQYLGETDKPRHVQHALSEIEKRISKGDEHARRWYPRVASLAESPEKEVRLTAAWVMGADARSAEFREPLARLTQDGEPIVRRNAALSLVGSGDARALPELRAMLKPYTVAATSEGIALTALTEGSQVRRESLLVRVKIGGDVSEVRSPLDGKVEKAFVKEGDHFRNGAELFVIAPDPVAVGDALEGLKRLGTAEDLAEVERYARGVEGMPDYIKNRAAQAAEAIKRRAGQS
ncbi:MAG TPA: HEAT repeat domain-containing protein [Pyrinomonadaceae bacterium]|nr:HEAT repeat domain-containing protein [Pyrinomonadaceae bacterium]